MNHLEKRDDHKTINPYLLETASSMEKSTFASKMRLQSGTFVYPMAISELSILCFVNPYDMI